jgi:hypothetical protein
MDSIIINKFNGNDINYSIQKDVNMLNICVFNNINNILYYQTYKIVSDYCGDIYFTPIKNEFNDGTIFSTKELKILLDSECEYPDVDFYDLNKLFNLD